MRKGGALPAAIDMVDVEKGRRAPGTPDGKSYAYGYSCTLSDLFYVRGLK